MAPRERDEFYKDNYLRRDGKRIVTVTREPGETLVGRPCEHVIVKENDRLILDAQLTKDVPGARSYFHLYRRLGAFSEEVLEKLAAVEGVPLRAKITVVTALPTYTLDVEVLDLREVEVTPAVFELPAGSKKLDELPAELLCGNCGMQLEKDSLRIPAKYRRPDGSWVYFCSEACAETYVDATEKADPKVKPK
jgi:YHS domain-containing protein